MALLLALGLALSPLSGETSSRGPAPARRLVCVERPEDMGRLNITPTTVSLSEALEGPEGNPEATLIGGQNVCFAVRGEKGRLSVRFPYPYGGPGERVRYWTMSFQIDLRRSENDFELSVGEGQPKEGEKWIASGWHKMWQLRRLAN